MSGVAEGAVRKNRREEEVDLKGKKLLSEKNKRQRRSSASSSEGEAEEEKEVIDIEFEINELQEKDFHGLKALLQPLFGGASQNVYTETTGLADLLLGQKDIVGSVVKVANGPEEKDKKSAGEEEEESAVFGVTSVVNLQHHAGKKCVKQLKEFLLKHCPGPKKEELGGLFCGTGNGSEQSTGLVGWLLNERFVNCPPQLAPTLHGSWVEEVQWAFEDKEEGFRDANGFAYYLLVAKTYTMQMDEALPGMLGKTSKQKKKSKINGAGHQQAQALNDVVMYENPEEEFFAKAGRTLFSFPMAASTSSSSSTSGYKMTLDNENLKLHRHIILVPAYKVPGVLKEMNKHLAPPNYKEGDIRRCVQ
eukprot:Nk52_evm39s210 gene=Nk52_evmTU39s210